MFRPAETTQVRGRRRQAQSQRRDEITKTACSVFAQRGIQNTTMRDVADATGILAGSLYHHYRSKDDLLVEVLRRFYADTLEDVSRIAAEMEDPETAVASLIELAVHYIVERRDEALIIGNDAPYLAQLPAFDFVFDAAAEVESIWLQVLERARAAGHIRKEIDLPTFYRTVMGSMFAAARWYQPTGRMKPAKLARHQVMLFFDGARPR